MVMAARSGWPSEKRRPVAGRLLALPLLALPVLAPHEGCNEVALQSHAAH